MGDPITASGTQLFIRATAVTKDQADSLAEFEAMVDWIEVGLIESLGEFGDEANMVNFAALGDGRVRKSKGARDAGAMAVVCAHDPADEGQGAMEDAEATNQNYPFKVILPDAPTSSMTNTIIYFRGLVASKRKNVGENDNIVRNNFNVAINSELFTNPSH